MLGQVLGWLVAKSTTNITCFHARCAQPARQLDENGHRKGNPAGKGKGKHAAAPATEEMTDEQLSSVNGFEVIHSEHGSIKWIDAVDLRGLELDKIVYIGDGSIFVYHDDELPPDIQLEPLPKTGNGLNKRAMLTMNNIFPESDEDDLQEYENELKKYNENLGFKFKSYEPRTGQWMFLVPHFNM